MTDESKVPQTNLTQRTQLELGANLDYALAFYNDGSAKLFKPLQKGIIEIKFEDYVPADAAGKPPCCIIGTRPYCPCPIHFSNPDGVTVTDLSEDAQSELGGDSLNYVLAFYTDDSARLFKPQQRDMIIEIRFEASTPSPSVLETNAQSLQSAPGDSMSFASSSSTKTSCIIGGRPFRHCPL